MKIVVIDDDPTGSQTVHGCLLLLSWDVDLLKEGLRHPSPFLFVLANTRALLPDDAADRNREICLALHQAIREEGLKLEDIVLVSRGDSTLRGHGVLEPNVIADVMGPFSATLHIPAFFEAGRITVDGVHLLNGEPVHKTPFAQDRLFSYTTSDLAAWLEEKSKGSIPKENVQRISLDQLDEGASSVSGLASLQEWLCRLNHNQPVVVDAEKLEQLIALSNAVKNLIGEKRFLFRSAASFINALVGLKPKLIGGKSLARYRRKDDFGSPMPGMVIVGSHVPLADRQLARLLEAPDCVGVEVEVKKLLEVFNSDSQELFLSDLERRWSDQLHELVMNGKTPVLFSSRGELLFSSAKKRLLFGSFLAQSMSRMAISLAPELGYLISKGGITTNTLLVKGMGLNKVHLEGQVLPGLSLVRAFEEGSQSNIPILTFPGNLGDVSSLHDAWRLMEAC